MQALKLFVTGAFLTVGAIIGVLALRDPIMFREVLPLQPTVTSSIDAPSPLPGGTYQPFTPWQKLRFGATSLINPTVAEKAAVVYSFEPSELLAKRSGEATALIKSQLAAGSLKFAQPTTSGQMTIVPTEKVIVYLDSGRVSDAMILSGKFLSKERHISDASASGEWIAWVPQAKQ